MEKRAAAWLVELRDKAVRLDERVFGVLQPALGPFQRRLQEIGGIAPLVFGQYGELSASFEALIDTLAVKGCDQAADHYLLDVGPGAGGEAPDGLAGSGCPTGGAGACLLGRGPLGGVALRVLPVLPPLRWGE
mgnify:CR=1 FL=1